MSSTSPKRYHAPPTTRISSATLPRSRCSSGTLNRKDLSVDEGSALNDMHRRADKQSEDRRKMEAIAQKYWDEKKIEEREKFSDEETDSIKYRSKEKSPRNRGKRGVDQTDEGAHVSSNGLEGIKTRQQNKEKLNEVEKQLKDSMLSNAQLYKEKTAMVYQIESLKDRFEDLTQEFIDLKAELQREQSQVLHQQHERDVHLSEIQDLKKHIQFRDDFMERLGLQLPTGNAEQDAQTISRLTPDIDPEEKQQLLKEIQDLKDEISSMKSSTLLGDHQPKDIVQVSTKLVSEYKTKLQIAEAENSRLDGMVNRLKGQVTRYKNQVKELEEREDELMKEKRHQAKEIRSLQSESEDQKTEIDLMKRRIEQLRKRRDYGVDS